MLHSYYQYLFTLGLIVKCSILFGQAPQTESQIILPGPDFRGTILETANGDQFGRSLGLSGDVLVVGAPNEVSTGAVHVFVRQEDGQWVQTQRLQPSKVVEDQFFGVSAAIQGDQIVVGAIGDDAGDVESAGAVYVFERMDGVWIETQKLVAGDVSNSTDFGFDVDIFNNQIAVSTLFSRNELGEQTGALYIFEKRENDWLQIEKLIASDGHSNSFFGWDIDMENDRILVGAYQQNGNAPGSGAAYLFRKSNGTWKQAQKFTSEDVDGGQGFGYSVALERGNALIGAAIDITSRPNTGSVYVFEELEDVYMQVQKILSSGTWRGRGFGSSLDISRNRLVVGIPLASTTSYGGGAAELFEKKGGVWKPSKELLPKALYQAAEFGKTIALEGDVVIISAPIAADLARTYGSAYHFDLTSEKPLSSYSPKNYYSLSQQSGDHIARYAQPTMTASPSPWFQKEPMGISSSFPPSGLQKKVDQETESLTLFPGGPPHLQLRQNNPNPFRSETTIEFYLPEAGEAMLNFFSLDGRLLGRIEGEYVQGVNQVRVDRGSLQNASGIVMYQLEYNGERQVRRMVVVD